MKIERIALESKELKIKRVASEASENGKLKIRRDAKLDAKIDAELVGVIGSN